MANNPGKCRRCEKYTRERFRMNVPGASLAPVYCENCIEMTASFKAVWEKGKGKTSDNDVRR